MEDLFLKQQYSEIVVLGQGGFGTVYKVVSRYGNKVSAIKIIRLKLLNKNSPIKHK